MENHVLTQGEAERLGLLHLAGETVQVVWKKKNEKAPENANTPIMKDVFYKGERLGGTLSLDE